MAAVRDAGYHGSVVLRAVLAGGGSLAALRHLRENLLPAHFTDREQQALFIILGRYADQTRGILPRDALPDVLREYPPGTAVSMQVLYDTLAREAPQGHEFFHSVAQLRELFARDATGAALAAGRKILYGPYEIDRGHGQREVVQGHEAARRETMALLAAVERDYSLNITPEGNVTSEGDEVLAAYAEVKELRRQGRSPGVKFGLPGLDAKLGDGIRKGEMALVASWMSGGKSSFCAQAAWHASVIQGLNVVVFTTEQLRDAVRLKLVARHSAHLAPRFGQRRGLDDQDIRAARLDEEGERFLSATTADLKTGGYVLNVVQVPDNCTVSGIAARWEMINAQTPIDLTVIDYLQLLVPELRSRDSRVHEDQGGIVQAAARFKTSCDHGKGTRLLSPWQINRDGQQQLKNSGGYALENMSSTLAGGQSADVVLFLAAPEGDNSGGRLAPVELTVGKNRSGPKGHRFPLTADFATSSFWDRETGGDDSLLDPIGA